ncbi:MAG: ATP synthase F0 subunit C [Planctomycetota bacterium]|jgi:F-type H+-transporting ATPase subunit c|nr:ATP synthase F0 subunit C [Planctomycetota bacterium]
MDMGLGLVGLGAGLGAGIALLGGGGGIGRLAAAAMEGIARQPEAAGDIKGGMIITAAFIEGATLFAVVVCLLLALGASGYLGSAGEAIQVIESAG